MIRNVTLAALGALCLATTTALADSASDAWQRYQQIIQPQQQWYPPPVAWQPEPAPSYLAPLMRPSNERLTTTCYVIGNIITCY